MDIILHGTLLEQIKLLGYTGITFVIFAESGLFFGFFLPGDSLLFTAGLLASQGYFNIYVLGILVATAAIIGDSVGYLFGYKVGPALFKKKDSFFFRKEHLIKTELFYEKHGSKAVILARFIPVIRTFTPILAGVAKMKYPLFLKYNIIGGLLWGIGISGIGYVLGTRIPNIDTYLLPIIIGIVFLSFVPILIEYLRNK